MSQIRRAEITALYSDLLVEFLFGGGLRGVARFQCQGRQTAGYSPGYSAHDRPHWAARGTEPRTRQRADPNADRFASMRVRFRRALQFSLVLLRSLFGHAGDQAWVVPGVLQRTAFELPSFAGSGVAGASR